MNSSTGEREEGERDEMRQRGSKTGREGGDSEAAAEGWESEGVRRRSVGGGGAVCVTTGARGPLAPRAAAARSGSRPWTAGAAAGGGGRAHGGGGALARSKPCAPPHAASPATTARVRPPLPLSSHLEHLHHHHRHNGEDDEQQTRQDAAVGHDAARHVAQHLPSLLHRKVDLIKVIDHLGGGRGGGGAWACAGERGGQAGKKARRRRARTHQHTHTRTFSSCRVCPCSVSAVWMPMAMVSFSTFSDRSSEASVSLICVRPICINSDVDAPA